jgi:hypothetical protein
MLQSDLFFVAILLQSPSDLPRLPYQVRNRGHRTVTPATDMVEVGWGDIVAEALLPMEARPRLAPLLCVQVSFSTPFGG